MILALAGTSAFALVFPVSIAIFALLVIVTLSYEQTIHAYPGGGGAYIVSRDNLGEFPAQVAGAALLMDYILTVAVSMSSGVAQVVSAFPSLFPYRAWIAIVLVMAVMLINLRGVRESGTVVAVPTFFFIGAMYATVGFALFRQLTGTLGTVPAPPPLHVGGGRPGHPLPASPRVLERYDGAHRRRGDLERHPGVQGAPQPQRRHHAAVDVGHPRRRCSSASATWRSTSTRSRPRRRR